MFMRNWPVLAISTGTALFVFAVFWSGFAFINRNKRSGYFFLDPQDSYAEGQPDRKFPLSARQGTFEPLLKHYISVAQLVFTVAAGSIALGWPSNQSMPAPVAGAKLILAWCILYGVLFCGLLLWRYDEYGQDKASFTLFWYSLVFALGFSCLLCFVLGYLVWGVAVVKFSI
jgi:hypothetical protein